MTEEAVLSDNYLKGWRDGKDESKVRADKKFKEFMKKLKEEINIRLGEDKSGDGSYDEMWGDSTDDFINLIDKLAEKYLT